MDLQLSAVHKSQVILGITCIWSAVFSKFLDELSPCQLFLASLNLLESTSEKILWFVPTRAVGTLTGCSSCKSKCLDMPIFKSLPIETLPEKRRNKTCFNRKNKIKIKINEIKWYTKTLHAAENLTCMPKRFPGITTAN